MATPALQTADQMRRVATLLTDAANAFHARLIAEAQQLDSPQIFARLQDEQRLRGLANQLFFEAADCTIAAGVADQLQLEQALVAATAKLASFKKFARAVEVVADLLTLGGAIFAAKPAPIVAALKEVVADAKVADDAA